MHSSSGKVAGIVTAVMAFVIVFVIVGGVVLYQYGQQVVAKQSVTMTVVKTSGSYVRFKESSRIFECDRYYTVCDLIEPGDVVKVTYGPKRWDASDPLQITEMVLPS